MRGALFLLGYRAYRVDAACGTVLFDLFHRAEISPKGVKRYQKQGEICFFLPARQALQFERLAADAELPVNLMREGGAPSLVRRFLKEPGLVIGVLLAISLLTLGRLFLWEIQLSGNETLTNEEIEQSLALAGLSRGRFLPGLDTEAVSLALRRGDGRIAYVGINVVGTVAFVQVREGADPGDGPALTPANLVAKCEGVVTMPLVFEGECLVAPGDVVRAGQLLASGLIDTQNHGYRVTRAAGQVLARTVHTYEVRVDFLQTEKCYTGRKKCEISLFFFDCVRKVFKSTGKNIEEYDIIRKIQWFTLPDGKRLPFGYAKTTMREYEQEPVTLTALQARAKASAALEQLLLAADGCTLLQRTVEIRADAEGITLVCVAVCEEDIAAVSEFTLTP